LRTSIQNALLRGHPKLTAYGCLWEQNGSTRLSKVEERDREARKRLLSPESDSRSNSDFEDNYNEPIQSNNRFILKRDQYENKRTDIYPKERKITSTLDNVPKPPSLPLLKRLPAPPPPSPRSKTYQKLNLSNDFDKDSESWDQIVDHKEDDECKNDDHSLALMSTVSDDNNTKRDKKSKVNALNNKKDLIKDMSRRTERTKRGEKAKNSNKLDSDNEEAFDEHYENDTNENETIEKPKRKYHERYFILKEIR